MVFDAHLPLLCMCVCMGHLGKSAFLLGLGNVQLGLDWARLAVEMTHSVVRVSSAVKRRHDHGNS